MVQFTTVDDAEIWRSAPRMYFKKTGKEWGRELYLLTGERRISEPSRVANRYSMRLMVLKIYIYEIHPLKLPWPTVWQN